MAWLTMVKQAVMARIELIIIFFIMFSHLILYQLGVVIKIFQLFIKMQSTVIKSCYRQRE